MAACPHAAFPFEVGRRTPLRAAAFLYGLAIARLYAATLAGLRVGIQKIQQKLCFAVIFGVL